MVIPKFTMLIGLPGCGKSTLANKFKNCQNLVVVSSDAIREELFGDENVQTDPEKVFNIMFQRTVQALENNNDVIYDATNINRKLRINTLSQLKKSVSRKFITEAVVIYTEINEIKRRNLNRSRVVPENVIDRMLKCFDLPVYNEGWNFIGVHYSTEPNIKSSEAISTIIGNLPHDNPHHKFSVDEHMKLALLYYLKKYDFKERLFHPRYLREAILLHDIGKAFCKSFINRKEEKTDVAHYYNHANVGSYLALGIIFPFSEQEKYSLATLIAFHMRPLEAWKESKKAEEKDRMLLGDTLYNYLKIVNECDVKSEEDEIFIQEVFEKIPKIYRSEN